MGSVKIKMVSVRYHTQIHHLSGIYRTKNFLFLMLCYCIYLIIARDTHITSCSIFTTVLINEEYVYWSFDVNKLKTDQWNNLCKAQACGGAVKGTGCWHIMQAWLPQLKGWLFGFQGKRFLQLMFQATSNLLYAEVLMNAQRGVSALVTYWLLTAIGTKCAQAVPFISTGRKPRPGTRLKLCCALVRPLK